MYESLQEGCWRANSARFIENMMDTAHFPWVHAGILGVREKPEVQDMTIQPTKDGFQFEIELPYNFVYKNTDTPITRRYQVILPFMLVFRTWQPGGKEREINIKVCSPICSKETKYYSFIARNYERPSAGKEEDKSRSIREQDRLVVESQRPEELPLDLSEELHLRGPDTAAVEYRRRLRQLGVNWS